MKLFEDLPKIPQSHPNFKCVIEFQEMKERLEDHELVEYYFFFFCSYIFSVPLIIFQTDRFIFLTALQELH